MANGALPAYVTILLFFRGLLVLDSAMPVYWVWFRYLTFNRCACPLLLFCLLVSPRDEKLFSFIVTKM